jgi:hypothetical protein
MVVCDRREGTVCSLRLRAKMVSMKKKSRVRKLSRSSTSSDSREGNGSGSSSNSNGSSKDEAIEEDEVLDGGAEWAGGRVQKREETSTGEEKREAAAVETAEDTAGHCEGSPEDRVGAA